MPDEVPNLEGLWDEALCRGLPATGILLVVDVARQRLTLIRAGRKEKSYVISTSEKGLGHQVDSLRTPAGWHEIVERYGDGEPPGRVFVDREPTPRVIPEEAWAEDSPRDLIMTRILRLAGLDDGVNRGGRVDTYERYIYFHAANHEHRLGQPASHGCIHLGNHDMIDLYDRTDGRKTFCWIGLIP